jgi:hypothetical protein
MFLIKKEREKERRREKPFRNNSGYYETNI